MERAFRQGAVVDEDGRVVLSAPGLAPGTPIEAILLVREADDAQDAWLARAVAEGEEDVAAGRTRPAEAFFAAHAGRYGVPG